MARTDIISLCSLVLAVLGGVYSVGVLKGRVDQLNPKYIENAKSQALQEMEAKLASFEFSPATEPFEWKAPNSPKQMIAIDDGICYLTLISGFFHDSGENGDVAKVFVLGEYWYLGGSTSDYATWAQATCWRFPTVGEK